MGVGALPDVSGAAKRRRWLLWGDVDLDVEGAVALRSAIMAVIAVLLPSQVHLQRFRSAVRDRHELLVCADWERLTSACDVRPVTVVVVGFDAAGKSTLARIRQLKFRHPALTVMIYTSPVPERARDLFDAGRAGVDALVLTDVDDAPRNLVAFIDQAERRGVAGLAARTLVGLDAGAEPLSPTVRDALLVAVTRAHERLSPRALAEILGIGRRHLARELAEAGFPPPQRLISWGRLMVAAHLLHSPRRRADAVARTLAFPSGSAFRNICQYYLRATPQQIRARGGAAYVLRVFLLQITSRRQALAASTGLLRPANRALHLAV